MQAINPVDVHVESELREGKVVKKTTKSSSNVHRTTPRMRTQVVNKTRTKKTNGTSTSLPLLPKQVVTPKLVLPARSPNSSPNRGPWVPPPGRSTKGQKVSWQSPESRLEINPVTEFIIDDDDGNQSDKRISSSPSQSTTKNEKLMREIESYEQRIQGLVDGISMLKERIRNQSTHDQTDQLRSDIDSSLHELERLQQDYTKRVPKPTLKPSRSRSLSPIRNKYRSSSADDQRKTRIRNARVSFLDDPIIPKRRARSTTPKRGPIHLNPDRERLLISLTDSEADVTHIIKQISSVKDLLTKLKFDNHPLSFEVDQLCQHRNELLHLIEQFERSNSKLKEFLRHQYHLEAEDGMMNEHYDTLKSRAHELENENEQIRRLLLNRENDNIALQNELERTRTHAIGFDTMKTSLEHNRAHLQRELYAREGEINRLRCALRKLEHDHLRRPRKRSPMYSTPVRPSSSTASDAHNAITIEKLQADLRSRDHEIDALKQKFYENKNEQTDEINPEVIQLRAKLEQAERLVDEYRAQLHTETLKTSANNSKNHLSELELERTRARLQRRIEELEPLPALLKQVELKNDKLQQHIQDLEKRSNERITPSNDRLISTHSSYETDTQALQRKIRTIEEQNGKLSQALHAKEEELRLAQSRLSSRAHDFTSTSQHSDTFTSKETLFQKNTYDLEQQISKLHLEYAQLKREKEELERNFKTQLSELRDKLERSNSSTRAMQTYVNSLKTTYTALFSDTVPTSFTQYTTTTST
ncbi:unnamed protein product [Adineta ricciae]|uniref:Uncharacterized protein n=1 Tax=Adineta ricciae TaxID=249248 RepID=A0A813RKY5_ADIRI|nr:unnamed protein product [Adineta ricciae]